MTPAPTSNRLRKVNSGSTLLSIIGPAAMYQLGHEEPGTPDEAEQIADALSTIHSWAETGDDGDPGDRVRAGFELTQLIKELDESGWSIYAATTPRKVVIGDKTFDWPMATIHVAHTQRAEAGQLASS
jgi:hypothetical protein